MRFIRSSLSAALLLSAASCTGTIGPSSDVPEVSEAGPARVRRLTRREYDNSVFALLGQNEGQRAALSVAQGFAPEDTILGFSTHDDLQVTSLLADQIDTASGDLAAVGKIFLKSDWECAPGTDEEACARQFIHKVGSRAFRRPLTAEDEADLMTLWRDVRKDNGVEGAAQMVLQGIFASASFLYRTELGSPYASGGQVAWLTQHEIASALSFAVTAGPPDAELLAAADAGELRSAQVREAHARRLLATPDARRHLHRFVLEWLGITGVANLNKNNQVYPDFSAAFKASAQAETTAFIDHVLTNEGGSVKELLGADYTIGDVRMALFYGATPPANGRQDRFTLPPERTGILTHASVLATYGLFDSSSPIRRGKFIYTRLLCQPMEPPPPNIIIIPPAVRVDTTTRARFAAHTDNPACAGCHRSIDPIGFGMEDFDGLGKYRTTENNLPVDASGAVPGEEAPFTFTGGGQLARHLANSDEVADCVPLQLFRYLMGREQIEGVDEPLLAAMREQFRADPRLTFSEAVVSLVKSPYFVHRRTLSPE